jgi:hypothetical protein
LLAKQLAIEPTETTQSCVAARRSSDDENNDRALLSFSQSLLRRRF